MAQPRRRATPTKRDLLRADLRRSTPEELSHALQMLLDQSRLSRDERLHALASALVVEALAPYWVGDRTPNQAHDALCADDEELARVIEALAPMLLGHIEVREEARDAVATIEAMLGF
ncbi:MAG: hypothetical protein H6674_02750 [Dehalococcoidia bacterium]|nr:hypothetical protein [Dehalococcoidia bacterium]MCB9490969.1 hypothetical protein [Dehalococcoidia bacterium]